ncbi:MAG: DEAD/DEAH box helicase, partial [Calditrichaeota bacterium]
MITDSEQPFNPLDTDVTYLKGVGPARAEVLAKVGIRILEDLLEFRPRRYLDRTTVRPIAELVPEEVVTVVGEIIHKDLIRIGRRRLILRLSDGTDTLEAIWFNQPDLFARIFAVGQTVAFSGKVTLYQRHFQMAHPDFDILEEEKSPLSTGQLIPIYPSGQELKKARITNYTFRRIFHQAFQRYRNKIPETLPEYLRRRYRLLSRSEAYYQMHFPESPEMLHQVERRFKYEELFYLQLLVALRRRLYHTSAAGVPIHISPEALEERIGRLPFPLTGAQRRVLEEIRADLAGGQPMNRLVQGDVGSGKTVVALLSMQMAIAGGYQTALMAPTEILAQQHYLNIRSLTEGQNLRIALLIGSLSLREKQSLHRRIAAGKVDLLIGTHALIQEQVEFRNLGLVVIDEQHRFGVMQRAELIRKG